MNHHVAQPGKRDAIALMYHALADGMHPAGQDPHYTLEASAFARQLEVLAECAETAGCARDWLQGDTRDRVVLTFDDGHESNHRLAFPALVEHGMRADFFVNPANVGLPGYATWQQLREMSDAGMSIQSHGYDHVYLTRLGSNLRASLVAARKAIEDHVGAPVTLLAPPGGRVNPDLCDVARECGYAHVLGSRPGRMAHDAAGILPRLSVTRATDARVIRRWLSDRPAALLRETLRYSTLAAAKRLLGDRRYERMRASALSEGGG
jgi:peptidoglycan/xylan/chitin deacetylase (PgdA/CDA1 family)